MSNKKAPTPSDFPSHLQLTITPPPPPVQSPSARPSSNPQGKATPNILLLLHGLGDTAASFTSFARALHLPETTILTLQAPHPLPFDLPGFHWGDDVSFDPGTGGLDMDGGFERAVRIVVEEVVRGVLVRKCGYTLREVLVLGFGQGGMLGLAVGRELGVSVAGSGGVNKGEGEWLSGVISIGAPYPLSASSIPGTSGGVKNRTPVLLVGGRDASAVTDGAVQRTRGIFEFVEVHRYARKGDGMPRNRDEMLPVMQFFARRLRSWKGVPEGSVEVT